MPNITIITTINTKLEKIWELFTFPEHIVNWNHASSDWHCPSATNDLQVGGEFHFIMAAKDKSVEFDFNGVYTKILPNEFLGYTIAGGREIEVKFEKLGENETRVTEIFAPENINSLELQQNGWQAILNNFKAYAEGAK